MGRTRTHKNEAPEGKTVTRVAAYLRVSTDEQRISGLGIAAQRTRVQGMAAAKGWPEPVQYLDDGISGTKEIKKRPALAHLLAEVTAGRIDAVIVLSLDRLSRITLVTLNLVETFRQHGVTLVSCKEQFDTDTPQGQFFLSVNASFAQLERDLIAERTKAALAELSRTTGDPGGRVPYGYVRTADGLQVDNAAAAIVRRIYGLRRRGLSLRQIAEKVRESRTPGPRGGRWHHTSITEILKNRAAYMGGTRGTSAVRWPAILGKHAGYEDGVTAA